MDTRASGLGQCIQRPPQRAPRLVYARDQSFESRCPDGNSVLCPMDGALGATVLPAYTSNDPPRSAETDLRNGEQSLAGSPRRSRSGEIAINLSVLSFVSSEPSNSAIGLRLVYVRPRPWIFCPVFFALSRGVSPRSLVESRSIE